jgi:ABC-2 type transport system ATP-binding protein
VHTVVTAGSNSRAERSASGEPAIRAEALERRFGDIAAVDGVDIEIKPGEIYGFLGPNGAGKSTTVRVLCTLLAPTGGRASVAGYDVAAAPEQVRLRIGVALQEAALDPKQTGIELLRLQGRLYGLTRQEIAQRLDDLSQLVDIGDALGRRIATYSGGMKRRLDLAAALVHNPDVLFLDEPTTGLDPVSRARVWEEVRRLNRELGMTIFLTTQYLEEADELADRVGIINAGRIVAEGTPEGLKRSIGNDVIFVRLESAAEPARAAVVGTHGVQDVEARGNELVITVTDGAASIGPVAVALNNCEVPVRELTLRTPTLDDVFLELTGSHIQAGESGDGDGDGYDGDGGTDRRPPASPDGDGNGAHARPSANIGASTPAGATTTEPATAEAVR